VVSNSLIEDIKSELENYIGIDVKQPNVNELIVLTHQENGVDILLKYSGKEFKLNFNEYSKHFDESDEDTELIQNLIVSCLTGNLRLETFLINGRQYKWKLQVKDSEQKWSQRGTAIISTLNFWTKRQIKYLQNDPRKIESVLKK
jgi:hypothetical protein